MNPVWKLNFFLFNIEGYGEFFSGITAIKYTTWFFSDIIAFNKSLSMCKLRHIAHKLYNVQHCPKDFIES
jgi:hypothetical protein